MVLDYQEQWEQCINVGASAVEPLIAVLKDNDRGVRASAADALGQIGDTRAAEPLIAVLQDGDRGVRTSAVIALGRLGDSRVRRAAGCRAQNDDRWGCATPLSMRWVNWVTPTR